MSSRATLQRQRCRLSSSPFKTKQKGIKEINGSDCRKEISQSGDRVAVRVMLQAVLAVGIRENECQEGEKGQF